MAAVSSPPHLQFASLYVGDLHPDVTEAILHAAFEEAGNVASCRICRDSVSRKSLCYGYVNYYSVADAERALENLNYSLIKGRPCRVMWSQRDSALRKNNKSNVFVRNLDTSIDNRALHDTFSIFGNILSCKVATDVNGRSKGHGFVHYQTEEAAKLAIEKVNGMEIAGSKVFVGPFLKRDELDAVVTTEGYTNLYVKHMPDDWDEARLKALFQLYGEITSSVIMSSNESGKRFALVSFKEPGSAAAAVAALHRKEVNALENHAANAETGTDSGAAVEELAKKEVGEGEEQLKEEARGDAGTSDANMAAPEDGIDVPAHLLYVQRAQTRAERKAELDREREKRKGDRTPGVRLCVRNLSEETTVESLRRLFEPHGTVLHVIVRRDEETGKCKGLGFVVMASMEEATQAVKDTHLHMVDGKPMNVGLADKRNTKRGQGGADLDDFSPAAAEGPTDGVSSGQKGEGKKGGRRGDQGKGGDGASKKGAKGDGRGGRNRNSKALVPPPLPPPFGAPVVSPPFAPPLPGSQAAFAAAPRPPPFPPGVALPPSLLPGGVPLPPQCLHPQAGVPRPPILGQPLPGGGLAPPGAPLLPLPGGSVYSLPPASAMPPPLGAAPHGQPVLAASQFGYPQGTVLPPGGLPQDLTGIAAAGRPPVAPLTPASLVPNAHPTPPPPTLAPGVVQLTMEALASLPPRQQKQQLGERLFPLVRAYRQEQAGKITGMMLELPNEDIIRLLQNQKELKKKVDDAVKVLQGQK